MLATLASPADKRLVQGVPPLILTLAINLTFLTSLTFLFHLSLPFQSF